ncbi:unnamed protein product [Cylicocyclus nassatus]|uniref:Uncharacterized protein n=1 Tax=Cylicocyclus nassatus TaxID=53992 RepID=A0AA36M0I3_CYLNA|nr:unnamed protein product [Cylicocyclus nassatus]
MLQIDAFASKYSHLAKLGDIDEDVPWTGEQPLNKLSKLALRPLLLVVMLLAIDGTALSRKTIKRPMIKITAKQNGFTLGSHDYDVQRITSEEEGLLRDQLDKYWHVVVIEPNGQ